MELEDLENQRLEEDKALKFKNETSHIRKVKSLSSQLNVGEIDWRVRLRNLTSSPNCIVGNRIDCFDSRYNQTHSTF